MRRGRRIFSWTGPASAVGLMAALAACAVAAPQFGDGPDPTADSRPASRPLEPARRGRLRVFDADGAPILGAWAAWMPSAARACRPLTDAPRSSAEGVLQLPPGGGADVLLVVGAEGCRAVVVDPPAAGERRDVNLPKACVVAVRVKGLDGAPVPGCRVVAFGPSATTLWTAVFDDAVDGAAPVGNAWLAAAVTDAAGEATLRGLPPGRWLVAGGDEDHVVIDHAGYPSGGFDGPRLGGGRDAPGLYRFGGNDGGEYRWDLVAAPLVAVCAKVAPECADIVDVDIGYLGVSATGGGRTPPYPWARAGHVGDVVAARLRARLGADAVSVYLSRRSEPDPAWAAAVSVRRADGEEVAADVRASPPSRWKAPYEVAPPAGASGPVGRLRCVVRRRNGRTLEIPLRVGPADESQGASRGERRTLRAGGIVRLPPSRYVVSAAGKFGTPSQVTPVEVDVPAEGLAEAVLEWNDAATPVRVRIRSPHPHMVPPPTFLEGPGGAVRAHFGWDAVIDLAPGRWWAFKYLGPPDKLQGRQSSSPPWRLTPEGFDVAAADDASEVVLTWTLNP
ncbi:MAG TPA: carboxypeptidase-like regulatory domain-containing protein [Planctomycetota bacterium]|nr:carboxypeptidase-like regulatory domain-containing protein [Planctomycetota bacterium]